jgi:hypothetical protein
VAIIAVVVVVDIATAGVSVVTNPAAIAAAMAIIQKGMQGAQ